MEYRPRVKTKVLVTVKPWPSLQVKGTRSSLAPAASAKDFASELQVTRCVGAASPDTRSPVCRRYNEAGGSRLEQPDRNVGSILAQRILQQIGLIQFAALQIDHDVEHVGRDMQRQKCTGVRLGRSARRRRERLRGRRWYGRGSCGRCRRSGARDLRHRIAESTGLVSGRGQRGGALRPRRRIIVHPRFVVQVQDCGKRKPQEHASVRH